MEWCLECNSNKVTASGIYCGSCINFTFVSFSFSLSFSLYFSDISFSLWFLSPARNRNRVNAGFLVCVCVCVCFLNLFDMDSIICVSILWVFLWFVPLCVQRIESIYSICVCGCVGVWLCAPPMEPPYQMTNPKHKRNKTPKHQQSVKLLLAYVKTIMFFMHIHTTRHLAFQKQ